MGKIWFQTSDGKNIHIPVVGEDVNTPSNPIVLSGIALATQNRCLSSQISIVHPTYGSITLDFTAPNRTGSCNQCGQCCSHTAANCLTPASCAYVPVTNNKVDYHACQYLTILPGGNKGIGKTNGTECSIRSSILNQFKGCALFPQKASDVASFSACGFTFSG